MEISVDDLTNCNTKSQIDCRTTAHSVFHITKDERDELADAALSEGEPAWQLLKMLGLYSCHYTLHWHHLFLDKADADKRLIHNHKTIAKWKAAIRKRIGGAYYFCLEVGRKGESRGLIHAHVVAGCSAGFLSYNRGYSTKVVKYIKNTHRDRKRLLSYLLKPSVGLTEDCDKLDESFLPDVNERVSNYLEAARELGKANLPELRGFVFY